MSWLRSWERNERRAGDGGMDAERCLLVPEQVSHWVGTYLFLAVIPWPTRSVFNPTIHPGKSFWVDESLRAGQKITGMSSAFTNEAKMQHLCCFTSYCIWGMAASPFFFWLLIKPTIWRKCKGHFSWFSNIIHETKGAIYNQEDKTDCKQQLSTPSLHPSIHRSRVDSAHPELTHFNFFIVFMLWHCRFLMCWSNPASDGLTAVSGGKHCSSQRGGWPLLNYINLLFCGFQNK